MSNLTTNTKLIKNKAYELGFSFVGISKAGFLEEEAKNLDQWLNQGMHGEMKYMANHYDMRLDPTKLVEGAKSVVSLMYNYFNDFKLNEGKGPKISKYAYGTDYHYVVKSKLKELIKHVEDKIGNVAGRAFVDSGPVLEKAWAAKSGLGWAGKNANLINKSAGSFYFLSELILDLELDYDGPVKDHCGTCTKCIDACPTQAIVEPYRVDGSKCISYFTIELKEAIPNEMAGKFEDWAFGCDICQDVCPWNQYSTKHQEPAFELSEELKKMDWDEITEEVFDRVFKDSALKRTKFEGMKRNLRFIKKHAKN
ncbi:MAG: tRNA epoxyqueuosine(34) reductase QueG [Bacteroidetes bacterium]|nr:tRNA epoxyqueuosine(34) reductase QueG [Bacteroidota bacterium]